MLGTFRHGVTRGNFRASRRLLSSAKQPNTENSKSGGWYAQQLAERPLATKAVTASFVVASGDALCQLAIEKRKSMDWARSARFALIGGALVGPTLHVWFGFLFSRFPQSGFQSSAIKVAADQLVFAPVFNPVFLAVLFGLEGRLHELPGVLKESWLSLTMDNWKVWVPSQCINFSLVPVQYQVLWANATAVLWNAYLSYRANENKEVSRD